MVGYATLAAVAVIIIGATKLRRLYRKQMSTFENLGIDQVRFYLAMLLERGRDGSFIIFEEMSGERFLQFRKNVHGAASSSLGCDFPLASWSRLYYQSIQDMLTAQNKPFDLVIGSGDPVSRFIRVDFRQDVDAACRFVQDVFTHIFQMSAVNVRAKSHGIRSPVLTGDRNGV